MSRYEEAMKNPEFAKLLEAESLAIHVGELLTDAMHRSKTDKFFLVQPSGVELSTIEAILSGSKADIKDLAQIFYAMGLKLEISVVPLES